LVAPQSFPHLWKKLWKFAKFGIDLQFSPGFSGLFNGAKPQKRGKNGSGRT
jgi:hypothetical protein